MKKNMKKNYIFVGDSIVYGIGDYENNGWTSMFKKRIINMDEDSLICNNYAHIAAFPGATSTEISQRINSILDSFTFDSTNNEIILSIGVNDTQIIIDKEKNNINRYKENIINIINSVRNHNTNITILGLTRIGFRDAYEFKFKKFIDNSIIEKYDEILKNICDEYSVKYIPMYDVLTNDDFIDGLHPNGVGHTKIYNRVLSSIYENELSVKLK